MVREHMTNTINDFNKDRIFMRDNVLPEENLE